MEVEEKMTEDRKIRRRRRRIDSEIKPEEQKPRLPLEESSESSRTSEESRRRRRIHSVIKPEEQKTQLPLEERWGDRTTIEEVEKQWGNNLASRARLREEPDPFTTRQGINEIRSELMEESNSALIESGYWDETHSWGSDDEEASDEYWHFVGRYE